MASQCCTAALFANTPMNSFVVLGNRSRFDAATIRIHAAKEAAVHIPVCSAALRGFHKWPPPDGKLNAKGYLEAVDQIY